MSAEVFRNTSVSPVTGFVMDCPVVITSASLERIGLDVSTLGWTAYDPHKLGLREV